MHHADSWHSATLRHLPHDADQLRELRVLEMPAVRVPVQLRLQTLSYLLLLAPRKKGVVRGTKLNDAPAVTPDPVPLPWPAEVP